MTFIGYFSKKGPTLFCEGPSIMKALFLCCLICLFGEFGGFANLHISNLAIQHFNQFPFTWIVAVPQFG
jgi:hypothetical protein